MERRLAAVLLADVVGYSRLMEADEAGTLASLRVRRATVFEPAIAAHGGRIVKDMGDGILVEFGSAVNAVAGALELQRLMQEANADLPVAQRIVMRVGINLGDLIGEGSDIYGESVNLAARLEALAEPGGICVSAKVHDEVRGKLQCIFEDMGEQVVKNVTRPVRAFRLRHGKLEEPVREAIPIPTKPSIAVLPFTSMSSDPEQEIFADGLTEDLITDLSRNADLFVIARNSTFVYKGKPADARTIARDLGVRYLLEGSARRAAGRVRINAQLIDAVGGGHLWAERFDRGAEDVFAVQDEVTAKIVEALVGRLTRPPARNRPKSIEAYDLCVRARRLDEESPQASREAHLLLQQAIGLDPNYAEAHRWLALNHWIGWTHWGEPMNPNRRMALTAAEKAVTLDQNDAGNRWVLGMILAYDGRWAESDAEFNMALELDPNNADALAELSDLTTLAGRPTEALEQIHKALRLNPHPPIWYYTLLGQALYAARHYEAAVEALRKEEAYGTGMRRFLAASLAQLGRLDEARQEAALFMVRNPHFTITHWTITQPIRDDATGTHFVDGFRRAGLPD